jgi:hypothetical protein
MKGASMVYVMLANKKIDSSMFSVVIFVILMMLSFALSIKFLQMTDVLRTKSPMIRSSILITAICIAYSIYLLAFTFPSLFTWFITLSMLLALGIFVSFIYSIMNRSN